MRAIEPLLPAEETADATDEADAAEAAAAGAPFCGACAGFLVAAVAASWWVEFVCPPAEEAPDGEGAASFAWDAGMFIDICSVDSKKPQKCGRPAETKFWSVPAGGPQGSL